MAKEIAEEYASSLADLTVNSKPLINMLTILAEENIEHAGVIVETVESHLEKVPPDIKLPVLYLVDSIIKNVGGAYTQKFSQIIVNMFTKTFKQVDEKIRSQMFKLRETWHEVFPSTKLYQLDVKVNLIDPAWPIQAQPHQSNIHVNPNFLKKPAPTTSTALSEEERMRSVLAKKEQELLMLQRKKVEMELEQTRRQLQLAEKNSKKLPTPVSVPVAPPAATPAMAPPVAPVVVAPVVAPPIELPQPLSIKQRLGPPVNKTSGSRIAPVSAALASARRDPRLARRQPPPAQPPPAPAPAPAPVIAPNVFDIKPLERGNVTVTTRKNVITIDVRPDAARDPRTRVRRRPDTTESVDAYIDRLRIADPKKINRLPPIPKINREDRDDPPVKRKKEASRGKKRRDGKEGKESSSSSPEKRQKSKVKDKKIKLKRTEAEDKPSESEVVAFKELKNYHKERYMRRNKEKSESPERIEEDIEPPEKSANPPDVSTENKDVDLRVLQPVITETAAPIVQKRPSSETLEGKVKKTKHEKFDILFGHEDVDLRQLPQVEEVSAPPPPSITENNSKVNDDAASDDAEEKIASPIKSPRKDWQEVKAKEDTKKTPSKLDLVRAKLAEATKGKDGLGRPLLFSKSPSIERERRRTLSSEEADTRTDTVEHFDAEDHKKSISIIMNQAKEQFTDGQLDKNEYNALMYQVLQLNEKLKLNEAKQRERQSFEVSKRKLKAHIKEENKVNSPKSSPSDRNNFGDIDERVTPAPYMDIAAEHQNHQQDSDMRMNHNGDRMDGVTPNMFPLPPMMPMFMPPYPRWRGPLRPRMEEFGMRRFRGPVPPYFRLKFDKRGSRPPFEPRMPLLPTPKLGMCQGESPLLPYERSVSPPPLGAPGINIPSTDFKILEYIDQDPVKTIQIDNVPREIRFYGETAIIMLDWDDPREIKFLPGSRRVTFDNKDSVVLSFNEGYKQVEIDDQTFEIRFGAPTRELYINGRWYECFFGGQPLGVIIDGKPRLIHLEGPLPQVDIGKSKRTDLVAGKINLIVNATNICPVYLDAKVQKFHVNGQFFTIRFVDSLRTVLINEQPFKVEFGDLPKPILLGGEKFFVRFSALPKNIKPGQIEIADMEGIILPASREPEVKTDNEDSKKETPAEEPMEAPRKSPSPEGEMKGLDMLANFMPTSMAPASSSEYSSAEPLFTKPDKIPGLETPSEEKPANSLPVLASINVNDLYAKLVATGIVSMLNDAKPETKSENIEEVKPKPKEDKNIIHKVDLLKSETLRVQQPGIVSKLYGGMQCSGCGARFPPEHTVRYSQHLDWHFRQNRRERDSARRAHSRHWHYDLSDWLQYEELEDLEEREKSWFETGQAEEGACAGEEESPSVAAGAPQHHCALCGDRFQQFYNEDKEEWHLRNSVRHDQHYYHPLCLQDYKASLTKEEPPKEETPMEITTEEEKTLEAIEIKDDDVRTEDAESDSESVVEVVEPEIEPLDPVEIDEGDEDDVVLKAEPVEQVVVEDADTDDETAAERADRDQRHQLDCANIKIKQEPIDPDDEPIITAEVENIPPTIDTTHNTVTSSIDGNVQLDDATPAPVFPLGGIRINISKTIPSMVNTQEDKIVEDISVDDEPLPPGEEPELEYKLKPALEGVQLTRQPPVQKGNELSGLCSIM